MKNIKLHYAFFLLCLLAAKTQAQNRNIFFVHGLGGDETSWSHYITHVNNTRQANAIGFSYTQTNGLGYAAMESRNDMASLVPAGSFNSNIAIGHSQGGLVIRAIARDFPGTARPFGGFITVGTPNHGAAIINSYQTGALAGFTQDATAQLTAGPNATFLGLLPPWVPGMSNHLIAKLVENTIIDEAQVDLPTAADMAVGGPYITALQNHVAAIPKVGIAGVETSPNTHWKTLTSYALKKVNNLPFNEVDDNDLEQHMGKAQQFYSGVTAFYRLRATLAIFPWRRAALTDKAEKWEKGLKWFANSEHKYLTLIGAAVIQSTTQTYTGCPPQVCSEMACTLGTNGCNFNITYTINQSQAVTLPNDGLVTKATQQLPGAIYNFESLETNHAQLRNHGNVTEIFNVLFNGTTGIPQVTGIDFFATPKK